MTRRVRINKNADYKLRNWIKRQPCYMCGGVDNVDEATGDTMVTPAHIKPLQMGGKRTPEFDINNLIPLCLRNSCHQRFDESTKAEKMAMYPVAVKYTKMFNGEHEEYHSPHGARSQGGTRRGSGNPT